MIPPDTIHILLVEDDLESGQAMRDMLSRRGVKVTLSHSGSQAVDIFAKDRSCFDAVVADVRMPELTGVDVLRSVRSLDADFPVILITGYDNIQSAIEAIRLGAQNYILKPFDAIEDLLVPLQSAILHHRTTLENRILARNLKESERRFREFFENEPEYCYMISPDGIILDVNRSALRALGYDKAELLGQPFGILYAPECQAQARELHQRWQQTGQISYEELTIIDKTGNRRIVMLNASAVRGEDNALLHSVSIQCDITARKEAESALLAYQDRLRALALDLTLVEERQRQRIAVDLHDSLGAELCGGKKEMQKVLDARTDLDPDLRGRLEGVFSLLSGAIEQVRSLTFDLFPPALYVAGLVPALEDLADRVTEQWGIHVQIQANETFDSLHQDDRILLYRAAHELLENVGKHAQAANAHLRVSFAEGRVELQVEDDGKGFDVSAPTGKGIGLLSIKERMHSLGGEFSIESVPGRGTLVRIAMPVRMQEDVR